MPKVAASIFATIAIAVVVGVIGLFTVKLFCLLAGFPVDQAAEAELITAGVLSGTVLLAEWAALAAIIEG
jgi:hypothetical protein